MLFRSNLLPAPGAEVVVEFEDGTPAVIVNQYGEGADFTLGVDLGVLAANVTADQAWAGLDELFSDAGCRKTYETGNYRVEAGMWHNDAGERLLILVNHDTENARTAPLPDGTTVTIEPMRAHVWTSDRGSL